MLFNIYLLICGYFILHGSNDFASVKALVGDNVRSARENEFPFIVAIAKYVRQDEIQINYFCGGSLISKKDVLTSEHCLYDKEINGVHVLVGSSYLDDSLRYYPRWWLTFDQWAVYNNADMLSYRNDIAILKLISSVINEIEPANIFVTSKQALIGLQAKVAGWGLMPNNSVSNVLQVGTVTILSDETCSRRVSRILGQTIRTEPMNICTAATPYILLRPGDSGSPIFCNNSLIGVNFGASPSREGSFNPKQVNVHEYLTYYYNFLASHIESS